MIRYKDLILNLEEHLEEERDIRKSITLMTDNSKGHTENSNTIVLVNETNDDVR